MNLVLTHVGTILKASLRIGRFQVVRDPGDSFKIVPTRGAFLHDNPTYKFRPDNLTDYSRYVLEVAERQGDEPDRKQNLLLLNKADLVSEEQRKIWANYFQKEGIEFIFFSAIEEQEKIEDEKEKV